MSFKIWESKANDYMIEKYGLGIDDIPDMEWRYWFKDEMTPEEAVEAAIERMNSSDGWW